MDYKLFLKKQFEAGKICHAYLLSGKYADKDSVFEYVRELLSVSREDTLRVGGEGNIPINEIKELKKELCFAPFNSPWKIAIISPADNLATDGQNALLKILEEPAAKAVILLAVNDEGRMLPTIMSRCQKIRLMPDEEFWNHGSDGIAEELLSGEWDFATRFRFAEELSKKGDLTVMLDSWILQIGRLMRQRPKEVKYLDLLREISDARDKLKSNVSNRLVMDNLLLKF